MIEISFDATQVAAIYNGGNKEAREAIKKALGDRFSEVLPIQERIKTFDDAYNELGEDHPLCRQYRTLKYGYTDFDKDIMAYAMLRIITTALNEGWEPQFTPDEGRWYGWYDIISKEAYDALSDEEKSRCVGRAGDDTSAGGGLVYSDASDASTYPDAHDSSRLDFKSKELAEYAAQQFIEIYADFCFIPTPEEK